MYKPIANDDYVLVGQLMNFYRRIYKYIGVVILLLGILLMPFLEFFIEGNIPTEVNIYFVYCLYLFSTVVGYFLFSHKKTLLMALQRDDIISKSSLCNYLFLSIVQLVILSCYQDYYLFVVVIPVFTICENVIYGVYANTLYHEYQCEYGEVNKLDKEQIYSNVKFIFLLRISQMTRNTFDTIFISMYLGLVSVTVYSNYFYVISAMNAILLIFVNAIRAAIGNDVVKYSVDYNYSQMSNISFAYMWITSVFSVIFFLTVQDFMNFWVGDNYLLDSVSVCLFTIYFYVLHIGVIRSIYIECVGLWKESRNRAKYEMILNIVLNWMLVKCFGIYGILVATILTVSIISQGYGSYILYRHYFHNKSFSAFILENVKFFCVTVLSMIISVQMCELLRFCYFDTTIYVVTKLIIAVVISNIMLLLFYYRDLKFTYMKNKFYLFYKYTV